MKPSLREKNEVGRKNENRTNKDILVDLEYPAGQENLALLVHPRKEK